VSDGIAAVISAAVKAAVRNSFTETLLQTCPVVRISCTAYRSIQSRTAAVDISLSFRFPQSFQFGFHQPFLIIAHLGKKKTGDNFKSRNAIFQSPPSAIML
jgi:hypothetical protein